MNKDSLKDPKGTRKARLEIKKKFEERYATIILLGKVLLLELFIFLQTQGRQEPLVFPKTSILSSHAQNL